MGALFVLMLMQWQCFAFTSVKQCVLYVWMIQLGNDLNSCIGLVLLYCYSKLLFIYFIFRVTIFVSFGE